MKLSQICQEVNIEFTGQDIDINGLHTLNEATSSQISFFSDKKHMDNLATTKAGKGRVVFQRVAGFLLSSI